MLSVRHIYMSGWPSGLRRQTQDTSCIYSNEHSGPQMWAWVQIPLLTLLENFDNCDLIYNIITLYI